MSYRLQDGEPLIILIFVYWRWHLTALTVPTLAVIKHLDALNSIAAGFLSLLSMTNTAKLNGK